MRLQRLTLNSDRNEKQHMYVSFEVGWHLYCTPGVLEYWSTHHSALSCLLFVRLVCQLFPVVIINLHILFSFPSTRTFFWSLSRGNISPSNEFVNPEFSFLHFAVMLWWFIKYFAQFPCWPLTFPLLLLSPYIFISFYIFIPPVFNRYKTNYV